MSKKTKAAKSKILARKRGRRPSPFTERDAEGLKLYLEERAFGVFGCGILKAVGIEPLALVGKMALEFGKIAAEESQREHE